MEKKRKLYLNDLSINSFTTSINNNYAKTINGGGRGTVSLEFAVMALHIAEIAVETVGLTTNLQHTHDGVVVAGCTRLGCNLYDSGLVCAE